MSDIDPESAPLERKFDSMVQYEAELDQLIVHTHTTLRVFDRKIGSAFNTPERCEALRTLLLASRVNRVYIVLHETNNIVRDCPRLINLLRQFTHAFFIRQTLKPARGVYDPFALSDDNRIVRRFHYDHSRGAAIEGDAAASSLKSGCHSDPI